MNIFKSLNAKLSLLVAIISMSYLQFLAPQGQKSPKELSNFEESAGCGNSNEMREYQEKPR